jgi:hypothetical protein
MQRAKLLLDGALRGEAGGPNNPEDAVGHTGKQVVTVDNIHVDKKGTQADLSELVARIR